MKLGYVSLDLVSNCKVTYQSGETYKMDIDGAYLTIRDTATDTWDYLDDTVDCPVA